MSLSPDSGRRGGWRRGVLAGVFPEESETRRLLSHPGASGVVPRCENPLAMAFNAPRRAWKTTSGLWGPWAAAATVA